MIFIYDAFIIISSFFSDYKYRKFDYHVIIFIGICLSVCPMRLHPRHILIITLMFLSRDVRPTAAFNLNILIKVVFYYNGYRNFIVFFTLFTICTCCLFFFVDLIFVMRFILNSLYLL